MLLVREAQKQALRDAGMAQWIDELCRHVERWFPLAGAGLSPAQLRARVVQALERAAASHGFTSRRDTMRYVNLAAAHGWDFEDLPENDWMSQYLRDPGVSSVSARLNRLVQRCLADEATARANRLLWAAYPTPGDPFEVSSAKADADDLAVLAEKRNPDTHG